MSTVLIVDDDFLVAKKMQRMVADLDHTVLRVVLDADDAVSSMAEEHPEIVLLDMGLGAGVTGIDVLREARRRGFTGRVWFVSSYPQSQVADELQTIDYDGYIDKPIHRQTLERVLRPASNA